MVYYVSFFTLCILLTLKAVKETVFLRVNLVSEWFIFHFSPLQQKSWWLHVYLLL